MFLGLQGIQCTLSRVYICHTISSIFNSVQSIKDRLMCDFFNVLGIALVQARMDGPNVHYTL